MEPGNFIKRVKSIFGVENLSIKQLSELIDLQLQIEEDMIIRPTESAKEKKYDHE